VEAAFFVEEAVGGGDMNVGVEEEVVAKGVDGGSGGDTSIGKIEAGAEGVAEGVGGGFEEQIEEVVQQITRKFELYSRKFEFYWPRTTIPGLPDPLLPAFPQPICGLASDPPEPGFSRKSSTPINNTKLILKTAAKHGVPVQMLWKPS
jgi:hypothetical protein